ncbi:DUF4255 domain-containing protein (plasmid) [Deinococcus taeanensis]|uniref:DUF4255 domain-containing protein n=1 Tax=Deinococcus taeanensis TaxID=2737050 RepID=UPI001CDCF668|nr:DUF4255 domain-containing protein [Deinococcus taeanensis]UBV44949.1 DUF4255 domain-containing protein [Deinococcus taeanensis]
MIAEVQQHLRALIHDEAQLPRDAIDVRFAAPTSSWVASLTRPTLNFFLHDLRENTALRSMAFTQTPMPGGVQRHLAPRRMDLRFLVTVFFKAQLDELGRDEWAVLWRVLTALLRQDEWDERYLPEEARRLNMAVLGSVTQSDAPQTVFSSLGLPVRPHLQYTVTVPLDLNVSRFAPLVLERDLSLRGSLDRDAPIVARRQRSSWQLRDAQGRPLADALVRSDTGARAFTDPHGVVHLDAPREAVTRLDVLTLDGQRLVLTPHTRQAQLSLAEAP